MNQMQDAPEAQDASEVKDSTEAQNSPEVNDPPAARVHPRFATPQRIAFVQSAWHRDVIEECRLAFLAEIEQRGIEPARIDLFEVPGSFEIPLHVQLLARSRRGSCKQNKLRRLDCHFRRRAYKLDGGRRHARGDGWPRRSCSKDTIPI